MTEKKRERRIVLCGLVFSVFLCIFAGSVLLYMLETYIRNGIADMTGAVESAAPEQLADIVHLYKAGGLRESGQEILWQYGYGRDVFSFVPAWFGVAVYAFLFGVLLLLLFTFGIFRRYKEKELEKRNAELSGYLNKIMEGQYYTMPQRARKNLADNMADLSHQLKTPAASIGLTLALLEKKAWDEQGMDDIRRMENRSGISSSWSVPCSLCQNWMRACWYWKKKRLIWRRC